MDIEAISGAATVALASTIVFLLIAKSWSALSRTVSSTSSFADSIMHEAAQRFRDELDRLSISQSIYLSGALVFFVLFAAAYVLKAQELFAGYPRWQLLGLQNIGRREQHQEDERSAEVNRLGDRKPIQFIAKPLRGLVHDAVGKTGGGADSPAQRTPGLRDQQEDNGTGESYCRSAADRFDIHIAKPRIAQILINSVSADAPGHCDTGHTRRLIRLFSPGFFRLCSAAVAYM